MTVSLKEIIQNIRTVRKKKGVAKFRLAMMAGVSEGIVRNMDEDNWNPTLHTLTKIESAINELQSLGAPNTT